MSHWDIVREEVKRIKDAGRNPIIAFADSIFTEALMGEVNGNPLAFFHRWCETGSRRMHTVDWVPKNSIVFRSI